MNKKILFGILFLLFISFEVTSQGRFQKGHYIDLNGNKVEGLIKNEKWKNNPLNFSFKENESAASQRLGVGNVREFTITDAVKYIKATVDIDMSSDNTSTLSYNPEPEWEKKTAFLKVLLEGGTALLTYKNKGLVRFFYTTNQQITQLIYKRYNTGINKVRKNNYYEQQLINAFGNCESLTRNRFSDVVYSENSLTKIFEEYIACKDKNIINYTSKKSKVEARINIGGGLSSTSLNLKNSQIATLNPDFGNNFTYRLVLDGEIVLPSTNKNRWSFFIGIAKNGDFNKTVEIETSAEGTSQKVDLSLSTIEMPFGIRFYTPLVKDAMLSFHLGYLTEFVSEFEVDYEISQDIGGERNSANFFFGAGAYFKGMHIEARYNLNKNLITNNIGGYNGSKINSFSLVATYNILNKN